MMAIAGIVAGGTGSRMGADMPKQFLLLDGIPVIARTIEKFLAHKEISAVIVGVHPDYNEYMSELAKPWTDKKVTVINGGNDRNQTLCNIAQAALSLGFSPKEILVTHDAVRPFVNEKIISDSIRSMEKYEISTAAVPATDTILVSSDGKEADEFPLRSTMFQVQTPQSFRVGAFLEIYSSMTSQELSKATDACGLFMLCGKKVGITSGASENIKLTYPSDFIAAQAFLKN